AHERLEETKLEAVRDNNLELVQEILRDLAQLAEQSSTAAELARILQEPHFQSLLETHDSVASKTYETPPPSPGLDPTFSNQPVPPDAVRMVGIRKTAGEHLGVTFRVEGGELVIARILHGGMVAQQGLLHVGDIIKEGVGRRSLKNKLIMWDPDRYGTTVPYTSRRPKDSEREGQGYSFVSRAEMEADIRAGRYLEHGEYEGNLYGTRIDSIRGVVAAGRVCVLDVNPQEADLRRTVEESSRIQRGYGHYFDLCLVNSNLERTFRELQAAMEKLRTEPQWVPVSWVY
ncbi:MPP2, partial [Cervus elaphus hippelaphus]